MALSGQQSAASTIHGGGARSPHARASKKPAEVLNRANLTRQPMLWHFARQLMPYPSFVMHESFVHHENGATYFYKVTASGDQAQAVEAVCTTGPPPQSICINTPAIPSHNTA